MMWDFILRLFVAGILGAVVGLDREYRAKEAGYRTHFLVSLGSALIMVVSQYGFQDVILENSVSLDPSRVACPSGEWHRFHRGGYDHHPETIRAGIDYRRRYLGDRRYRSGRRLRHVRARYRRHFVDARRAGAVERYF